MTRRTGASGERNAGQAARRRKRRIKIRNRIKSKSRSKIRSSKHPSSVVPSSPMITTDPASVVY
jgi:hypothetical protein